MWQVENPYRNYGQAAEESFTDFPGGGDPKYAPQIDGVTNQGVAPANPADRVGLINDALLWLKLVAMTPPHNQHVSIFYTDESIVGMTVRNESKAYATVNYLLHITSIDHSFAAQSQTTSYQGQTGQFVLEGNLNTANYPGGFQIGISATTLCSRCSVNPHTPVFQGQTRFIFNP